MSRTLLPALITTAWLAACSGGEGGPTDMSASPADLSTPDLAMVPPDLTLQDMPLPLQDFMPPPDLVDPGPKLTGISCTAANVTAQMLFDQIVKDAQKGCAPCHVGEARGGNDMGDAAKLRALVGKASQGGATIPLITANNPDKSYLLYKIYGQQSNAGGSGSSMPQARNALSNDDRCLFVNWVRSGAQ